MQWFKHTDVVCAKGQTFESMEGLPVLALACWGAVGGPLASRALLYSLDVMDGVPGMVLDADLEGQAPQFDKQMCLMHMRTCRESHNATGLDSTSSTAARYVAM